MKKLSLKFDREFLNCSKEDNAMMDERGFGDSVDAMMLLAAQLRFPGPTNSGSTTQQQIRSLNRIQRALDKTNGQNTTLLLQDAEFEFLKDIFLSDNARSLPVNARIMGEIFNMLDEAENVEVTEVKK